MLYTQMNKVFLLFLIFLLFSSSLFAEGSFEFDTKLLPLLKKDNSIGKYLLETIDFSKSGSAIRIGQDVNPKLGGGRVGPYTIYAKPKGSSGPYIFKVTIVTSQKGKDEKGNSVTILNASRIEEEIVSIEIELTGVQ